jgi:hypothetical protein
MQQCTNHNVCQNQPLVSDSNFVWLLMHCWLMSSFVHFIDQKYISLRMSDHKLLYNFHRIWWPKILIIVFFSLTRFDLTWILGQRKSSLVNNWGFNLSSGSHIISRRFGVGLSYGCVEPLNHKHITVLFFGMLTKRDNILTNYLLFLLSKEVLPYGPDSISSITHV